ncbi:MAG: octaprenyl diphosphate synthase [Gammaproteobacteria bacterium]|nr:octaprenyl diphosphate synthase [Gammaproteobacteria bacterium]
MLEKGQSISPAYSGTVLQPSLDLDQIRALVLEDAAAVDLTIRERLSSEVVLIDQLSHYIINSGGKRLRPLLVLLSAGACHYRGEHHITLAAVIEFIHTATLLHDDVVDASNLRRGRETANSIWGNEASVLVGDFLYSRSFQMMVSVGNPRVMEILADTTNVIAEGEVQQLLNCHEPDTTEEQYRRVIQAKTAKLFEAGSQLGAILAGRPRQDETALARYGLHLGTAFQLVDDALDYSSSAAALGKNIGDDLAEGKPTLPLIHAMRESAPAQREVLREAVRNGGLADIDAVASAIESTGSIAYTAHAARTEAAKAIAALADIPDSAYRDALVALAEFAVERDY